MEHTFSQVPKATIPRSQFNRSHGIKTTFDAGYLVPIFVDEALPGDTFNVQLTALARLATPIVPIMDNIFIDYFFFAVPNRLLWTNWKKFMGEQKDPGDSIDYHVPRIVGAVGTGFVENSLGDYFGVPTKVASLQANALYFRAYNLIYNEWFRDENLINSAPVDLDDGPDVDTDYVLRRRGKRHDYFTSCLPWPQKQTTGVTIPLGTSAEVLRLSNGQSTGLAIGSTNNWATDGGDVYTKVNSGRAYLYNNTNAEYLSIDPKPDTAGTSGLFADLTNATASTINALRQAFQLQRMLERDARGGTRYVEVIRAHFGVISPDFRQQRPEYLGGGSGMINIHPIAQTSSTDATTPQGNLAAIGTHVAQGIGFVKSFTEHCILIGLATVRADLNYQQGLDRQFSRLHRYDYYWPALAHLGEQEVLTKEIYCNNDANDDTVFGYQERYAEYRYKPSRVTGLFRSNATGTLEKWHLAIDYGAHPHLDQTFIEENPPIDRVIAVPAEPHILFDGYFNMKCARPMPVYSVPGLIDHF